MSLEVFKQSKVARTLRTLRKRLHEVADPVARERHKEVMLDFAETKRSLGSFIGKGKEHEHRGEVFAVLSLTDIPFKAKFYALIAKAMQMDGYSPLILGHSRQKRSEMYYRLFGFDRYIAWDEHCRSRDFEAEADTALQHLLPAKLTVGTANTCRFRDIPVGTYALSSACRLLRFFPQDLDEPSFRHQFSLCLRGAITAVLAAERLFDEFPIRKLMLRDIGYEPSGPLMDVALRRGADCLVVSNAQRRGTWLFKRYTKENIGEHEFSISKDSWAKILELPWTEEMERQINKELTDRYTADSEGDTRRLQSGKVMMEPDEVRNLLGLDPMKKTAVIFAHISWDGAFFFGEDLFENFDVWLLETARRAVANPNLNWIIKLHPLNMLHHVLAGKSRLEEAEMVYLRHLEPLPPHVRILHSDTPINTYCLFPLIDYALTVRGTVGLEFPCFGIPALTAGTGRYDGRGFTIDSRSAEEYLERLQHLHELTPLTEEAKRLARIHYYHLMIRRQVSFEDIAPMELRQLNEADASTLNTIRIQAQSLNDIRNARSIRAFVQWAHDREEHDLFDPRES